MLRWPIVLLAIGQMSPGSDLLPECPSPDRVPAHFRTALTEKLDPSEYLVDLPDRIVVHVGRDANRKVSCASLLNLAWSPLWPVIVKQLHSQSAGPGDQIVEIRVPNSNEADAAIAQGSRCKAELDFESLLRIGRYRLARHQAVEAMRCFQLARSMKPESPAAIENLARAYGRLQGFGASLELDQRLIELRPGYFGAQMAVARSFSAMKQDDQSAAAWKVILSRNPPLPVKVQAQRALAYLHDLASRRAEGTEALRAELEANREIRRRDPSLFANWQNVFDSNKLALRLEEARAYQEAETLYSEALGLLPDNMVSEAIAFEAGLGQTDLAEQAQEIAEKIRTERDTRVLGAILQEAGELAKKGSVVRLP